MIATLLRALVIGVFTLFASIVVMVALVFDRNSPVFHWTTRVFSKLVLRLFGIRVTLRRAENAAIVPPCVYLSNHASMFDIPALISAIPDTIHIVLKEELTKVPFWGWALRMGPYIIINRSKWREARQSLEAAAEKVRSGKSVLLFPEGTRTRDGKLQPFKRGAFALASEAGVPIIPVAVNNTFGILPKGSWVVRPADIEVVLGQQILPDRSDGKSGDLELMEKVRKAIEKIYVDQS